jgi:trans-aconitate methyltransferase
LNPKNKWSYAMPQFVLIIGEDPDLIDFSAPGVPANLDARKVMEGINGSRDRLKSLGHEARILLTRDATTVDAQVSEALKERRYDVIVIGAGLRMLPAMAEQFERLINVLHVKAPQAKLAFNSQPADSDKAALRWLPASSSPSE